MKHELDRFEIELMQEALDAYKPVLQNKLSELEHTENVNKDDVTRVKCNIKDLDKIFNYLDDEKTASKDEKIKIQQLKGRIEDIVSSYKGGHYNEIEEQDIHRELQQLSIYLIKNLGVTIPPFDN